MDKKVFRTKDNKDFLIIEVKNNIIFKILENESNINQYRFIFNFDKDIFISIYNYIYQNANKIWKQLNIREAYSFASDYSEFYDSKSDNNGDFDLYENCFDIKRPSLLSTTIYEFNKKRMETFLYDFYKIIFKKEVK